MKRKEVERVKAQAKELLHRIDVMERCAGWRRFVSVGVVVYSEDGKPHPDDSFYGGKYTASVKRASMDLSKSLVELRR
jgi:hypothetical protein